MNAYIPTKEDLEQIIEKAVKHTVTKSLPEAIRKATRKKWLNTEEVMELLQCSRRHIQYLRDEELITFSQSGRTIRYDIEEVENFLNSHKVKSKNKMGE
ncbi:hypothetical protein A8B79_02460 [Balneola sp. EhC07]|uniref:helix-turn-helix domain-containing protein n=1 Tax=Balneola sp. EhC07 TaxID=1849360 RepID=UPI0007F42EB7|nr:helix-turn-helix domain-containing protein [Balneola sp. EhC07]OAN62433.1 hypothetical protein A8B79_02460 [Balneola sp. EhC07]